MTFNPFSPDKYLLLMTLAVVLKNAKMLTYLSQILLRGKSTVLSQCQAERAQGLYPDTTLYANFVFVNKI